MAQIPPQDLPKAAVGHIRDIEGSKTEKAAEPISTNQKSKTSLESILLVPGVINSSGYHTSISEDIKELGFYLLDRPLQFLHPWPTSVSGFRKVLEKFQPKIVYFECFEELAHTSDPGSKPVRALKITAKELRKIFLPEHTEKTEAVLINGAYTREQAVAITGGIKYLIGIPNNLGKEHRRDFLINFYQKFSKMDRIDQSFTGSSLELFRETGTEKNLPVFGIVQEGEYVEYQTPEEIQKLKEEFKALQQEIQEREGQFKESLPEELSKRERLLKKENPHSALSNWVYHESERSINSISAELLIDKSITEIEQFKKELKRILLLIEGCLVTKRDHLISSENLEKFNFSQSIKLYQRALAYLILDIQKLKFKRASTEFFQDLVNKVNQRLPRA